MIENYKEVRPTSEEGEEYLNHRLSGVSAHGVFVKAGTFLRRCDPAEFRRSMERIPSVFVCVTCRKRYPKPLGASSCCIVKIDVKACDVDFCTANTVTTVALKGCVYLRDTFKNNPNLISIQFKDLGLEFDRNQFKL
jgi:hypothetical protein